jgi:hypothetical protein
MATGLGLLTGYATVRFARAKGLPLQVTAVAAALMGIFIGKYFTFFSFLRQYVTQEYGHAAAASVSFLDPELIIAFFSGLGEVITPYDILWGVLAVLVAWRIPRRTNIRLPYSM